VKSRVSLAQATGSRLGETVINEPCESREFSLKRAATRLSYTCSTYLKPPHVLAEASLSRLSEMMSRSNENSLPARELGREFGFVSTSLA